MLVAAAAMRATTDFGVDAAPIVVSGRSVPETIVRDADAAGADLVVVALRPASPRLSALGSVAMAVTHHSRAAVLAVPVDARGAVRDRH